MKKPIKSIISTAVVTALTQQLAHAGGFSLYTEGGASEIGTYAAGSAAEAADATIGWYNPAGLVLLKNQQAIISGVGVVPSSKLTGTSTFVTPNITQPYTQTFSGLQGSKEAVVPSLHYVRPLGERAAFGLSVVAPYGLATKWMETSPVRYSATLTELATMDFSPEIAGRLTDHLSIGAGIDLEWARVKFNRMIGAPTVFPAGYEMHYDSSSYNQGQSFGVGFHAGLMGMFNDNHTRLGLNYQSKVRQQFNGFSQLSGRLADPAFTNPIATFRSDQLYSNAVDLPEIVTLSGYQDVSPKVALLASVVFTGWDTFKTIQLNNVAAVNLSSFQQVLVNSTSNENYHNAWRVAVGANYHVSSEWMMRCGVGYDQTPTNNHDRDVRLPDSDRWALAIGTHYQLTPTFGVDAGYSYLIGDTDTPINHTDALGTSTYNIHAKANVHAQLIGLQAVWTMDQVDAPKHG